MSFTSHGNLTSFSYIGRGLRLLHDVHDNRAKLYVPSYVVRFFKAQGPPENSFFHLVSNNSFLANYSHTHTEIGQRWKHCYNAVVFTMFFWWSMISIARCRQLQQLDHNLIFNWIEPPDTDTDGWQTLGFKHLGQPGTASAWRPLAEGWSTWYPSSAMALLCPAKALPKVAQTESARTSWATDPAATGDVPKMSPSK